jgi:hypothetical protein
MKFLKKYYRTTTMFLIGIFIAYLAYMQDAGLAISPAEVYCETSTFISQKAVPKVAEMLNLNDSSEVPCTETAI